MTRHVIARRRAIAVVAAVMVLAGCSGGAQARGGDRNGQDDQGAGRSAVLTVFAASSLTDAFTHLARRFEERTGATVRTSFAGSSTLATQIRQGAPAGVFASADRAQMRQVSRAGLVTFGPKTFVENREVLIVPKSSPAGVHSLRDLTKPGLRLVLAAEDVPAAEYAEQILGDAESRYGPKFRQQALANIVSREADVRAAVNRVVVGDADATFGYASDVTPKVRDQVKVIEVPPNFNVVAHYPIAALKGAENKELARRWISFVRSDAGQRVLHKWGFQPAAS